MSKVWRDHGKVERLGIVIWRAYCFKLLKCHTLCLLWRWHIFLTSHRLTRLSLIYTLSSTTFLRIWAPVCSLFKDMPAVEIVNEILPGFPAPLLNSRYKNRWGVSVVIHVLIFVFDHEQVYPVYFVAHSPPLRSEPLRWFINLREKMPCVGVCFMLC